MAPRSRSRSRFKTTQRGATPAAISRPLPAGKGGGVRYRENRSEPQRTAPGALRQPPPRRGRVPTGGGGGGNRDGDCGKVRGGGTGGTGNRRSREGEEKRGGGGKPRRSQPPPPPLPTAAQRSARRPPRPPHLAAAPRARLTRCGAGCGSAWRGPSERTGPQSGAEPDRAERRRAGSAARRRAVPAPPSSPRHRGGVTGSGGGVSAGRTRAHVGGESPPPEGSGRAGGNPPRGAAAVNRERLLRFPADISGTDCGVGGRPSRRGAPIPAWGGGGLGVTRRVPSGGAGSGAGAAGPPGLRRCSRPCVMPAPPQPGSGRSGRAAI